MSAARPGPGVCGRGPATSSSRSPVASRVGTPGQPSTGPPAVRRTVPSSIGPGCGRATPTGEDRAMTDDARPLVGTYRLVSAQGTTADGAVDDLFGPDPVGYMTYTADGYMFVLMMRADRPDLAA